MSGNPEWQFHSKVWKQGGFWMTHVTESDGRDIKSVGFFGGSSWKEAVAFATGTDRYAKNRAFHLALRAHETPQARRDMDFLSG